MGGDTVEVSSKILLVLSHFFRIRYSLLSINLQRKLVAHAIDQHGLTRAVSVINCNTLFERSERVALTRCIGWRLSKFRVQLELWAFGNNKFPCQLFLPWPSTEQVVAVCCTVQYSIVLRSNCSSLRAIALQATLRNRVPLTASGGQRKPSAAHRGHERN